MAQFFSVDKYEGLWYAVPCTHGYRFFFFIRANVINDVKTRTFQKRKKRIMVYYGDYDFVTGNALQQYYIHVFSYILDYAFNEYLFLYIHSSWLMLF